MTEYNFSRDENKDFGKVTNKRLQNQLILNNTHSYIEEKEFWTSVNKSTLSDKKARHLRSTRKNGVTYKENEILDRFECLIRDLEKPSTYVPDFVSHFEFDNLKMRLMHVEAAY